MKVVHLSSVDTDNGAAIAAYRLQTSLLRLGHDSSMFVAQRRTDDPAVTAFRPATDLTTRLRRRLRHELIHRALSRYKKARIPGM